MGHAKDPERSLDFSRRRARITVHDIALCNAFTHFVTLTLDPATIDRYDPETVGKKLQDWLKNMSRRKAFSYVIVPEPHQDSAIHFHGLCKLGSMGPTGVSPFSICLIGNTASLPAFPLMITMLVHATT